MAFELSTRDGKAAAERGLVVAWEDPETKEQIVDENGKIVSFTLLGGDAGKVRAKSKKNLNKHIAAIRKGRDSDAPAEEIEQDEIGKLSVATIAWSDNWTFDGETLACNEHNARKVYSDPRFLWLTEQMTRVLADRARFFAKSSTD